MSVKINNKLTILSQNNTSFDISGTFLSIYYSRPSFYQSHREFSGLKMKIILKALFLLVALTLAVPVFAQSDFQSTKARAEAGDAEAQYSLGYLYANGMGAPLNDQEAVKWYRLAAEQGNSDGTFHLGYMYYNGRGVAQNYDEAVKWYRLAAEQGNAGAQNALRSFDSVQNDRPVFDHRITRISACEEYVKSINTRTNRYTGEVSEQFGWSSTQDIVRVYNFGNNYSILFMLKMRDENGIMFGDLIDYWCVTDENTGAVIGFELAN